MKKRILSGIQPTGDLHFGNYFGAIQNWVRLQAEYDCTYTVVDYHAMTAPYDPAKLRENTWNLIYSLVALGVKPENLCIQSLVPEHTELAWILNCYCSYGELSRMTQFKDKSKQIEEKDNTAFISVGLFDYPVLQAADILIYRADFVPVGKDQEQHLELTRNIAERFNTAVKQNYFALPQTLFTETPKIMSLAAPDRKMSKSLGDKHYVAVFEDPKSVLKKIKDAFTDVGGIKTTEMSDGVKNLFTLLKACGKIEQHDELLALYQSGTPMYGKLKPAVGEALAGLTTQFREQLEAVKAQQAQVQEQIRAASAQIRKRAQETVKEVKELAGLANV